MPVLSYTVAQSLVTILGISLTGLYQCGVFFELTLI